MNKFISLIIFAASLLPIAAAAQEPVKTAGPISTGDVLTLNQMRRYRAAASACRYRCALQYKGK